MTLKVDKTKQPATKTPKDQKKLKKDLLSPMNDNYQSKHKKDKTSCRHAVWIVYVTLVGLYKNTK